MSQSQVNIPQHSTLYSSLDFQGKMLSSKSLEIPWFARSPLEQLEDEFENAQLYPSSQEIYQQEPVNLAIKRSHKTLSYRRMDPKLPSDPRLWSRADVCIWVTSLCSKHRLPIPDTQRFLMNGKAVCLMNSSMFSNRVPLGGKMLY